MSGTSTARYRRRWHADADGMLMRVETSRLMWALYEPVHAVTYFTPEARQAFEAANLRGYWRGYFAGRAAPLVR